MKEAIHHCEERTGRPFNWKYSDDNRAGDHIWYISDIRKFERDYPGFSLKYDIDMIFDDLYENGAERWRALAG